MRTVRNMLHMLSYCRPYWRWYLVGTLALIFVDVFDTFTPKLVQWAIDHMELMTTGGDPEALGNPLRTLLADSLMAGDAYLGGIWIYAVGYVSVVAMTGLSRYFMSINYARASITLTHDLRCRFFAHVQRLHAGHHDRSTTGEKMSLSTSDMDAVRMFFGFGLLLMFDTVLYFTMVPAYMATINVKLMLAGMLTVPLIPIIVAKLANAIEERYEYMQEQFAVLSERSRESYAGAKVVKSFVQEESEIRTFAKLSREYFRRGLHLAKVMTLENPLLVLLLGLADLVVVVYGGTMVISGEITVGEFFAFFQYLIRLSGPMIALGWVVSLYQRGRVSMNRIEKILNIEQAITEPENPDDVDTLHGGVEVRDLTFAYFPHGEPNREGEENPGDALVDINLKVEPGETLALVGPVGAGKTTLLNLLPRLYDPPAGTVFLDGHDVRQISLEVLRTQIGVVPQETFLFSESILDNIALGMLGQDEVDPEWLRECARIAQVDKDIEDFPKGFDTLLGERGVNLSGGQKQRVAIARAIARRPALLLLDDCLSAVDTHTEEAILSELKNVMKQCTTVIVSHRLSTVEHADEILFLDKGRIIERGKHDELLNAKGAYFDLWKRQQLEEEVG